MKYTYTTHGVCSRQIQVELDGDIIKDVTFFGGCHGNLQGISALVKGMDAHEAIERLEGICCGSKATSCPDQLARALEEALDI
ncbi:MAG: TIGR03905 family TSCPD domain-containing protein [Clostridia bacterium]|nr:TIGR03905 family TSCPD domain-containing protein [Clostridia bacterium]